MKRYLSFVVCAAAFAQQFEVATVKIAQPGSNLSMIGGLREGQFTARNSPLKELLIYAYGTSQITGGPDWLANARYDIVASAPAGAKPNDAPAMLRALLEERLGVVTHRDKEQRNVYALEAPRGAAKLSYEPNKKPEFPPGNNTFTLLNGDMKKWADVLGRIVDRPVVDRTGIEGVYYHMLAYGNRDDSTLPAVFTSLPEQTGLRLTATKAEVEVVVVDRAQQTPTEN